MKLAFAAVTLVTACALAGERGPGKYSGVVIFDRWGGCTLYSGIYVMYVSEHAKEKLRAHAGRCVQVDATEVEQPRNPGDGLIKALTVVGPAPAAKEWESPEGLAIAVAPDFEEGRAPAFVIRAKNVGEKPVSVQMDALAPTLLAAKKKGARGWGPSDGPSAAVVTRQAFWNSDGPRMDSAGDTIRWAVTAPPRLVPHVPLDPRAVFELHLSFHVPPGQYEFLAGYGGGVHSGRCIASNPVGFDVMEDGTARLAKAENK